MYSQTLTVPVLRVSSPLSPRSVPSICISPAADLPKTPALEPSPPEAMRSRSHHLLPPPTTSPVRRTMRSSKVADKKGLDESTFQHLLAANRERASRRSVNSDRLRREVVVKAHHNKQLERRALFLSRTIAPPSPSSTDTAVTPPESPAIFHFSLPSPGLASPLALFETVTRSEVWIERVDYKKPQRTPTRELFPAGRLPSLDQITARLRPTLNTAAPDVPSIVVQSPTPVEHKSLNVLKGERQDPVRPRSRIPATILAWTRARSASPPAAAPAPAATPNTPSKLILPASPPKSIRSLLVPQSIPALRMRSVVAPAAVKSWRDREAARSASTKTHIQTESWRREQTPAPVPTRCAQPVGAPVRAVQARNMVDKLRRRTSAPAELQDALRKGIPVGGF